MLRRLALSSRPQRIRELPTRWAHQISRNQQGAVQRLVVEPQLEPAPTFVRKHVAALADLAHASVSPLSVDHNFHGGRGSIVSHSLLNEHSRQASTLQLWTIAVGASEGIHVHGSAGMDDSPRLGALEELYVCLEGRGTVNIRRADDNGTVEDVPFEPGDAIVVPPGVWHGVTNVGAGPLRLLILWGPPAPADEFIVRE